MSRFQNRSEVWGVCSGGPDPDAEHEEDGGKWKWNQKGSDEVQVRRGKCSAENWYERRSKVIAGAIQQTVIAQMWGACHAIVIFLWQPAW